MKQIETKVFGNLDSVCIKLREVLKGGAIEWIVIVNESEIPDKTLGRFVPQKHHDKYEIIKKLTKEDLRSLAVGAERESPVWVVFVTEGDGTPQGAILKQLPAVHTCYVNVNDWSITL